MPAPDNTPQAGAAGEATDDRARALQVLAALPLACWEFDLRQRKVWLSTHLRALLGLHQDASADALLRLVHPQDQAAFVAARDAALAQGGHFRCDLRLPDAAGGWHWWRVTGRVWAGADGSAERLAGTVQDIDDVTLARQELQNHRERLETLVNERTARLHAALQAAEQARERAQQADRAKSAFLAHMSHEIRTPLNGLLGLTELALGQADSPSQRRYLSVALQSGHSLLAVINDVLEMSRLDSGAPLLVDEPFDVGDTLADALRAVVPLLGDKPVVTRFDVEGGPTAVRGDAARLRQIVVNLLGNAIKFTERGTITLGAVLQPAAQPDQVALRVDVADTGPGLASEMAERIFEPFFQGDSALTRRHEGTGLGLPIARGLARAMGGDLRVSSTPGRGSVFTLELTFPLQKGAGDEPLPPPGRAWLLATRAEDGTWVQRRLERLGWQAEVVLGLDAALQRAATAPAPDLLLFSPLRVVPATGDLQRLRRTLPHTRIDLFIRPNWADPVLEAEAQAQGVGRVVLPLSPRALAALLREARAGHAAATGRAPPGAEVLLVEDNEINRVIGRHLLEALGLRVRNAADGAQSLAACLERPPDLVVMDVRMPVMDGLEATRRLRALQREGRLPPFPVIGLSAHALDTDRAAALAAGMDDYLTKPVDAEHLREAVRRWVPARTDASLQPGD